MNVIRFNWSFVTKLGAVVVLAYFCLFLGLLLIQTREPSLKYDKARGHFLLRSGDRRTTVVSLDVREQFRRQRLSDDWWGLLSDDEDFRSFKFKHQAATTGADESGDTGAAAGEEFFQIKSVSMSYVKIAPENWVDHIVKAVQLGVNTVQIDVPWNVHEPTPGDFEFTVLARDLRTFIEVVDHYGLYVLIRFDPYLYCSDFDFGGLPSWLLYDKRAKQPGPDYKLLDLNNPVFFDEYKKYLNNLLPIVTNLQFSRGGPIIGALVQNFAFRTRRTPDQPFGLASFYNQDYFGFIDDMLRSFEFDEAILVLDPFNSQFGTFMPFEEALELNEKPVATCPDTSMRKYWNVNKTSLDLSPYQLAVEKRQKMESFGVSLKRLLQNGRSFNIANFVCSTNFGFNAGVHHSLHSRAAASDANSVLPLSTSVVKNEYECLIDENGHVTDKYWMAQDLFVSKLGLNVRLSEAGQPLQVRPFKNRKPPHDHVYGVLDKYLNINDLFQLEMSHFLPFDVIVSNLHSPVKPREISNKDEGFDYMEYLSRNFNVKTPNLGFVLYRLTINLPTGATIYLKPESIRDYAIIMCDATKRLATINMISQSFDEIIFIKLDQSCKTLDILVENVGRASNLDDLREMAKQKKGLLSKDAITFVRDSATKKVEKGGDQTKWEVHFLDFEALFLNRFSFNSRWLPRSQLESIHGPYMAYFQFRVQNSTAYGFKKVISSQKSSNRMVDGRHVNYSLQLDKSTSVYLLLSNYKKGAVFLNGFNLGRYWTEVGPLCTLYVPDHLLTKGLNELIIFELNKSDIDSTSVYFSPNHVLLKSLK